MCTKTLSGGEQERRSETITLLRGCQARLLARWSFFAAEPALPLSHLCLQQPFAVDGRALVVLRSEAYCVGVLILNQEVEDQRIK